MCVTNHPRQRFWRSSDLCGLAMDRCTRSNVEATGHSHGPAHCVDSVVHYTVKAMFEQCPRPSTNTRGTCPRQRRHHPRGIGSKRERIVKEEGGRPDRRHEPDDGGYLGEDAEKGLATTMDPNPTDSSKWG